METKLLQTSNVCGLQLQVYGTAQEPLFLAKDIATIIEHSDTRKMVQSVDDEEKLTGTIFLSGQKREVWMLTENGLYEVLMQSRKPIAKEFKKAVKQVLKEIRTKGGYIATNINDTPEMIMARALKVADETLQRHQQQIQMLESQNQQYQSEIKTLASKAQYTDEVLQSTSTYTFTQIAKELGFTIGIFTSKLKQLNIAYKQSGQWMLTAKHCNKGYTKIRTFPYRKSDGTIGTNSSTVFTENGRAFLHSLRKDGKL